MTYSPSESEKRVTAIVQAAAGVFLFVPSLVALRLSVARRSPYIQYWLKVNLYWSLLVMVILTTAFTLEQILHIQGPTLVLFIIHFVFCVTGALSSYFNTPFKYWFVAEKCCLENLADVYGQLVPPEPKTNSQ